MATSDRRIEPGDVGYHGGTADGKHDTETGAITGTADKDYNIIWFTEASLNNALRLEAYIQDAVRLGDDELADFFRKAQDASRRGGEQGKQLLAQRLGSNGGGA